MAMKLCHFVACLSVTFEVGIPPCCDQITLRHPLFLLIPADPLLSYHSTGESLVTKVGYGLIWIKVVDFGRLSMGAGMMIL